METIRPVDKRKSNRPSLLKTTQHFQKALSSVKELKTENPELYNQLLNNLAERYSDLLSDKTFTINLFLGARQFQKSVKRRASRKPLTYRKLESLLDDLQTLSKILKI